MKMGIKPIFILSDPDLIGRVEGSVYMKEKLPAFLQPYLASYDLDKLSIEKDKGLIITSILNQGDQRALDWLTETYTKAEIKNTVKKPVRGFWHEKILAYWLKIFDIKLSKSVFQNAVIKL